MLIRTTFGIFVSLKDMADSSTIRLVLFQVGDLVCAAPVESVREIIPAQPATRIPGAPSAVDGLVNVRGGLLTVVDAHEVLGRAPTPDAEGSILVLEVAGRAIGLVVDEVLDLVEVTPDSLDARESLPGIDPRSTIAVGQQGERVFVLLDTHTLLAPLVSS